jgi:hypothetical protein
MVAALSLGRVAHAAEIDRRFFEAARQRLLQPRQGLLAA